MFAIGEFARHGRVSVRMDLGFTLPQVARLTQVEARMAAIESEGSEPPPVIQPLYRELAGLLCEERQQGRLGDRTRRTNH